MLSKQQQPISTRTDKIFPYTTLFRSHQKRERERTENLVKADAATRKQLDDIDALIEKLEKQIAATRQEIELSKSAIATQNRGILSEQTPLEVNAKQLQEQIDREQIVNPISGIVLTKYALEGDMANIDRKSVEKG